MGMLQGLSNDGTNKIIDVRVDATTGGIITTNPSGSSGLTDTQLRASPVYVQDKNGEGSVTYITNTTPVTGLNARQVVCLADTVFATFTRTNSTGSITGLTIPAGMLLTGPITAITLTSGAVAAYV